MHLVGACGHLSQSILDNGRGDATWQGWQGTPHRWALRADA